MADPDVEVRGILVRPEGQTMMLDVREGGVLNIIVFEPQCEPKFGSKKIRHLGSPAPSPSPRSATDNEKPKTCIFETSVRWNHT